MKPRPGPRVFLALPVSRTVRARLEGIQGELKNYLEDWHFIPPANFHVTLRFFGEVPEETISNIESTCKGFAPQLPPFSLQWHRLDYFGPPRAGRVLFVDAKECEEFSQLTKTIMDHFPEDGPGKRFRPHITLAKARKKVKPDVAKRNSEMLRRLREPERVGSGKIEVSFNTLHREFVLMETIWAGRTVEYFPRARFEMAKGAVGD